jgi:metal-responsive CopG/Arc/MetJ family transcriptional regulator
MDRVVKTVRFPKAILNEIDEISSGKKTSFTEFITNAAVAYLRELKFIEKVSESAGCWNSEKHPELADGVEKYVSKIRKGRKF